MVHHLHHTILFCCRYFYLQHSYSSYVFFQKASLIVKIYLQVSQSNLLLKDFKAILNSLIFFVHLDATFFFLWLNYWDYLYWKLLPRQIKNVYIFGCIIDIQLIVYLISKRLYWPFTFQEVHETWLKLNFSHEGDTINKIKIFITKSDNSVANLIVFYCNLWF
jgi:hypothetical protein